MAGAAKRVLIVEDEQTIRDSLFELFDVDGVETTAVGTLAEARAALYADSWDLVVTDIRLGGHRDGGLQVMALTGFLAPEACVVVLTAYPDRDNRHASDRLGATYFLEKPVGLDVIATLAEQHQVSTALTRGAPGVM